MPTPLTIWCNTSLSPAAQDLLKQKTDATLLFSQEQTYNLGVSSGDSLLEQADVAFGQPNPDQVITLPRLKWVHLTTAGYTRYEREDLRAAMRSRSAIMTNSSTVYAEPCAQHALAFMMAAARRLLPAWINQTTKCEWPAEPIRADSFLLNGQTALIVGFGAIGQRLAELLAPFRMNLIAIRRKPRGDEPIPTRPNSELNDLLPTADHVINILPASQETEMFFNADRFRRFKKGAFFYNIGRGTTVDSYTLWTMLETRKLYAAYLDVTNPEPLPKEHPLWTSPHCLITPHTAGGHNREFESLVSHFLNNLSRFRAHQPLLDRII
ncbi:MAG TPA: D-2-hydroxyacid dehydrogenase [Tepidisphaeraceae bacterium]